ncbi:MAG: GDP-mannose 4,6-dehydratase [Bacteroidota bacterium]
MTDIFNNTFENKRVLITGDTGFKGSWLSIWLKELGAEVFGYALPPRTERDNFVTAGLANKVNHLDGDIRNLSKLSDYFNKVKPDIVFHLAAQPLVIESYNNPHYNFETNLMGTVKFF